MILSNELLRPYRAKPSITYFQHLVPINLGHGENYPPTGLFIMQRPSFRHQRNARHRLVGTDGYFNLIQRDDILNDIEGLAAPLGDVVQQVRYPAVVFGLGVEGGLQCAGTVVAQQRLGQ